ncbi:hypothetical protein A2V95_03745 [Candidatus Kuenenbacteria bacterium RBG_16_41_7]|uniref:Glycosyl transferase family 1 domain-containing protein n=2 Tax=Candidatus Kueneniibacteriota TaxID=1752740 RepID=A0A1F6FLJ1_9BACT|nr:MAG: hypothetical protein A3B87_02715 [Candidatus Kuenenbacteria bacterium RIFCSPHIGHO2_02_FULL_39_13]OGG96124.1 MAG: hypothetical protein A2V95_03745 [Candidatus Kuenenbacteria bacterium RBG_16_41_7]
MKTLIIHDRFQFRGGAERLVLILAKALNADIVTEFWTTESYDRRQVPGKLITLSSGEAPWIVWRYFRAQFLFFFKTRKIIKNHQTIFFSGNNCLAAGFHFWRGKKKILYCHHPVRHAFDLRQKCRDEQPSRWKKILYYDIGIWLIRFIYWLSLQNMNLVIANSENVKNRLQKFLHQKTDAVIYPPIQTDKFKHISQQDYYLSFGRVERLKRIPDIIRAFQKMPDKKLIVVSGGPDLKKIKKMAQGHDNIQIKGWVNDQELSDYVGNCIASIYIPIDEDSGMTQIESMSAGKPCIAVDEGGLKESIIDEQTGKFIPAKYSIDDIIKAVNWLTKARALLMREDCQAQAKKFSQERFIKNIKELIYANRH